MFQTTNQSIYIHIYIWVADKITILPAMDMAKVGGPLSFVHVFAQI